MLVDANTQPIAALLAELREAEAGWLTSKFRGDWHAAEGSLTEFFRGKLQAAISAQCEALEAQRAATIRIAAGCYLGQDAPTARAAALRECVHTLQGAVKLGSLNVGDWFTWAPSETDAIESYPGPCQVVENLAIVGCVRHTWSGPGERVVTHDSARRVIRGPAPPESRVDP